MSARPIALQMSPFSAYLESGIAQLIERLCNGECREISPTPAAFEEYEAARIEAAKNTIFGSGCKSWYLDDEGVPATWPWSQAKFREAMAAPRAEHFEFR